MARDRRPEYDSQVPDVPPWAGASAQGSATTGEPPPNGGLPENGFPEWGPGTNVDAVLAEERRAGRDPAGTDSTATGGSYYSRGGGGGGGGGGSSSSVARSISLTNPDTARGLLNSTLSQLLGREASQREFDTFLQALNKTERQSPTVTRSKTTASGTSATSTTVTKGGTDPAQLAKQFAESRQGYSEYQAATTFLNAFIEGIRNPGRVI